VDKPSGPTSHDVVARVRRVLGTRAAGHTGTLDPFATGLLVVLLGRATRLARFVERQAKTYLATARLGIRTTTDDLTGAVIDSPGRTAAEPPSRRAVEAALQGLIGPQQQRPPSYSAKRVAGERSYAKARRGEAVELAPAAVVVHAVELVGYDPPHVVFRCTVSAGTYVRALARDLGERLGVGAHLTSLRREAIGALRVEQAVPLEAIGPDAVVPPLAVLGHLPRVEVAEEEARALGFGQTVPWPRPGPPVSPGPEAAVTVTAGGRLIAIASRQDDALRPDVVLEARG
jgi:tRNA pseudouridine55 synthase